MPIGNVKKWESKDIPTPEEFNRIENSIQALDLEKKKNFDVLPISEGGTSATTVAGARKALGLGDTGGPVPIANGGTGAGDASAARKKPLRFFAEAFRRFVVYVFSRSAAVANADIAHIR